MSNMSAFSNNPMTNDDSLADQLVVEISDLRVRATHYSDKASTELSEQIIYDEPGIALLLENSQPIIGDEAQRSLKQHPIKIQSQFWSNLNTEPLNLSHSPVRHNADLVWHQISKIKQQTNLTHYIFLAPANFTSEQMQLLAGICQSLKINVSFFANMGLTQLVSSPIESNLKGRQSKQNQTNTDFLIHIDSQLHQLLLSKYQLDGQSLSLVDQETHSGLGLIRLIDRLLYLLSEKFIQHSRFDPLHSGGTEQQLFDQIMPILRSSNSITNHIFIIETDQKNHQIELSQQELHTVINSYIVDLNQNIDQFSQSAVKTYSPLLSQLPGFQKNAMDAALTDQNTSQGIRLLGNEKNLDGNMSYISSYSSYMSSKEGGISTDEPFSLSESTSMEPTSQPADALLVNHTIYTYETFYLLKSLGFPEGLIQWSEDQILVNSNQLSINETETVIGQRINSGDLLNVSGACFALNTSLSIVAAKIAHKDSPIEAL